MDEKNVRDHAVNPPASRWDLALNPVRIILKGMNGVEVEFGKDGIRLKRAESSLDAFVKKFTQVLERRGIDYVVVSGYVAIVFGRSRASEDVDFILAPFNEDKFNDLWTALEKAGFECINPCDREEGFSGYISEGTALRFALKGEFIPNAEIKFAANQLHEMALREKTPLYVNDWRIPISPIELQVAYKLFLGSEKDLEDARFLYSLFKERLDRKKVVSLSQALKAEKNVKYLEATK